MLPSLSKHLRRGTFLDEKLTTQNYIGCFTVSELQADAENYRTVWYEYYFDSVY